MIDDIPEASTLAHHRFDPSPPPETVHRVLVIEGPNVGASVTLDGTQPARVLVGQSAACDLRLDDREVSRRHAAFDFVDGRLKITDLASTNGTRVDHLAISECWLEGGETIRLGATALRVETASGATPPALTATTRFGRVLGASREMRRLYPLCKRLAEAGVPVLIEGETGTGKEVLAEALHEESPRAQAPFIVFDCTSVPPTLVESELFGHERGAFTGAVATRAGVFEQASGGTLLIDEIGDLALGLQPKFLRALERGEVRRVGGDRWIKVDVRIVSATRRDLDREVQEGRFRDDLFHRLAVARIEMPPLRRRRGDVAVLARHFCAQLGGDERMISADVLARWEKHDWPGNVRELRNAVARQLALGPLADVMAARDDAPEPGPPDPGADALVDRVLSEGLPLLEARKKVVEAFERRYIAHVLAQHGGNVVRAAAASGIARRYFQILKARSAR